jgi:hypothetical protein
MLARLKIPGSWNGTGNSLGPMRCDSNVRMIRAALLFGQQPRKLRIGHDPSLGLFGGKTHHHERATFELAHQSEGNSDSNYPNVKFYECHCYLAFVLIRRRSALLKPGTSKSFSFNLLDLAGLNWSR